MFRNFFFIKRHLKWNEICVPLEMADQSSCFGLPLPSRSSVGHTYLYIIIVSVFYMTARPQSVRPMVSIISIRIITRWYIPSDPRHSSAFPYCFQWSDGQFEIIIIMITIISYPRGYYFVYAGNHSYFQSDITCSSRTPRRDFRRVIWNAVLAGQSG